MPNPGSLGSIVPQDDAGALTRRVAALERLVQQMSTANSLAYATIDRGGVTITNGGSVTVKDTDGHIVAYIGALPSSFNRSDGSAQPGVMFNREDGSVAAFLGDSNPLTPPYKQSFQIYDRTGQVVVADDTNGGKGLAAPWVGGGLIMGDTNTSRWPQTTNGSFLSVSFGWYRIQNPRVQWDIQYVADAATAGEVRLMINGLQVDATQTVGTSFGLWTRYKIAIPGTWNIGDIVGVDLQARRTSGTGIIYAQPMRFSGDQSP
jgi:hypothetical protein